MPVQAENKRSCLEDKLAAIVSKSNDKSFAMRKFGLKNELSQEVVGIVNKRN